MAWVFTVRGEPVTQGSMVPFNDGNGIATMRHSSSRALKAWREAIAYSAIARGVKPLQGAVMVELRFELLRPKTVDRALPHVMPDLDKLQRAVLDALKNIAWRDDGQVVKLLADKVYVLHNPMTTIAIEGVS